MNVGLESISCPSYLFLLLFNHVWLFATTWTATHQASLSFTIFQSLLKLTSIASVMPSNHLILCRPFSSCTWSFPASGSFLMTWLFASGVQSIGTSASALPMNIQGWFPLELPGLILLSKRLSRVFSRITVWKHQFFSAQPSLLLLLVKWKNMEFLIVSHYEWDLFFSSTSRENKAFRSHWELTQKDIWINMAATMDQKILCVHLYYELTNIWT